MHGPIVDKIARASSRRDTVHNIVVTFVRQIDRWERHFVTTSPGPAVPFWLSAPDKTSTGSTKRARNDYQYCCKIRFESSVFLVLSSLVKSNVVSSFHAKNNSGKFWLNFG